MASKKFDDITSSLEYMSVTDVGLSGSSKKLFGVTRLIGYVKRIWPTQITSKMKIVMNNDDKLTITI